MLHNRVGSKLEANDRVSIMSYQSQNWAANGGCRAATTALREFPRSGSTVANEGAITFDYAYPNTFKQGNLNYTNFISGNTFSQGQLTAITCNFEVRNSNFSSAGNNKNATLSAMCISDTATTVNSFEVEVSDVNQTYSATSFTVTGTSLDDIFDYSNQRDFGVRFHVQTKFTPSNTWRFELNTGITLSFYTSGYK